MTKKPCWTSISPRLEQDSLRHRATALPHRATKTALRAEAAETAAQPYNSLFPYLSYISDDHERRYLQLQRLQVTVDQRTHHGLSFLDRLHLCPWPGHLELGHRRRESVPSNNADLRLNYGNSDNDFAHRFTFSPTYLIPGMKSPAANARRLVGQRHPHFARRPAVVAERHDERFPRRPTSSANSVTGRRRAALELHRADLRIQIGSDGHSLLRRPFRMHRVYDRYGHNAQWHSPKRRAEPPLLALMPLRQRTAETRNSRCWPWPR